jgi:uncharacterized protein YecE (DUF72 family)
VAHELKINRNDWVPLPVPPDITRAGFYIGTSGYYFDDWVGRFNPPKVTAKQLAALSDEEKKDQDRLLFYQKYFRFIEINTTFYQEPVLQTFIDFVSRSKGPTLYSVKVHKEISHTAAWDPEKGRERMRQHVTAVSPLIESGHFYSFLIQLEDHVTRSQKRLDYLLAVGQTAVRKKISVHVEFRHNSWHREQVLQALKDNGVGICNTEIPPVPHAFPLKSYATTDKGYIRYSGRNLSGWYPLKKPETSSERTESRNARYNYLYSDQEVRDRVNGQITLAKKTGMVAIAFNNHFQIKAIMNALYNIQLLKMKVHI